MPRTCEKEVDETKSRSHFIDEVVEPSCGELRKWGMRRSDVFVQGSTAFQNSPLTFIGFLV